MTISPISPVATLTAKRTRTIAPQAIIGTRLFHTSAMLVPIAVRASVRRSSNMGTEKALMASPNAAKIPPMAVPTTIIAQPIGSPVNCATMWSMPGNGLTPKNSA